jgi:hypothetical protein
MSAEQASQYVHTLNVLFVNKVITRSEFRKALTEVPFYGKVCQVSRAPKVKGKRD